MARRLEASLERTFVARGKDRGCWVIKFIPLALVGFPDRIVLADGGRIGFAELKRDESEEPEPIQTVRINRLKRMGFLVRVVRSTEDIVEFYRALTR